MATPKKRLEVEEIAEALTKAGGVQAEAARMLNVTRGAITATERL